MINYRIGQTVTRRFTTRNSSGTLYDPTQVQYSFLKGSAIEDALFYGGTSARDSWLTRISTGTYQVKYTVDVAGEWSGNYRYSDDGFITSYSGTEELFNVFTNRHTWLDVPPGPSDVHRVYWGVGAAGIVDAPTLEAMDYQDIATFNFTTTPIDAVAQKVYIAHPLSFGTPSIVLTGFPVSLLPVTAVSLHDANDSVVTYSVWETLNLLTYDDMQFIVTF